MQTVKATRYLICSSCSNWVDFVKSGCEKFWAAEVQADSFSFECRGCMRIKELEVELEQLRLLVVAVVGREQVGCASGSGGGGGSIWKTDRVLNKGDDIVIAWGQN